MTKISTILFDLGDVLIDINWKRTAAKLVGHIMDAEGNALGLEDILALLNFNNSGSIWDDYGLGRLDRDGFLAAVTSHVRYSGDQDVLQGALTEIFEPIPERVALFNKLLLNPDLKLAMVSDTNDMHIEHIENAIPAIFENLRRERRFYSYNHGMMKKFGADFYRHVLEKLGASPKNALMIDDQPKNKIGADTIGLNFLLIQKHEDLDAALKPYLAV